MLCVTLETQCLMQSPYFDFLLKFRMPRTINRLFVMLASYQYLDVNSCAQILHMINDDKCMSTSPRRDGLTSPRPVCQGGMTRPPPFLSGRLADLLEISQVFVTGLCLCPRETRNARSVDDMTSEEEDEEEAYARKPNCACICGCLYLVQERKILQARTGHRQAHVHETQTHPLEPNLQSASS